MFFGGPESLILALTWLLPLVVLVYGLVLAARLVRAVERIADRIDRPE